MEEMQRAELKVCVWGAGEGCLTQPEDSEIFDLLFGFQLGIGVIGPFGGNASSPNVLLKRKNSIRSQRSEFFILQS